MNFEELSNNQYLNYLALNDHLEAFIENPDESYYLFLDEIQLVDSWERVVNSIRAKGNVNIFITGSNSKMLSGELSTLLAGRYVSFKMFPLSYLEYREMNPQNTFLDYVKEGGMPMLRRQETDFEKKAVLEDIYHSVVLKDIVERNNVRNTDLLSRLILYVMSQVGHVFSALSISKYLKSEGRSASPDSILSYLDYCQSALLIDEVPFQDIQGKKILKANEKYYLVDHGLREAIYGNNERDIELILENIVYYELLRRGFKVTIGRNGNKEIDFVATKGEAVEYFQVTYLMAEPSTREREFGAYLGIDDNYPKYVLSLDPVNFTQNGIIHYNLEKWLLNDIENETRK
jgi:predicted AAA+ superfamily ATPase